MRKGSVAITGTHLGVWEDHVEDSFREVYAEVLLHLQARGWSVTEDPHTKEHYSSLSPWSRNARKGDLSGWVSIRGRCLEVEFFRAEGSDHPHGPRHEFDKYRLMSKTQRLRCVVEVASLAKMLLGRYPYVMGRGFDLTDEWVPFLLRVRQACEGEFVGTYRADNALRLFNRSWRTGPYEKNLLEWPHEKEYARSWSCKDRDGKPLRNGMTRYFRDSSGHLQRGVIFTQFNDGWTVIYGGSTTTLHSLELFDCARPRLERRRFVPGQAARLRKDAESALKAGDWKVVRRLMDVLERMPTATPASEGKKRCA